MSSNTLAVGDTDRDGLFRIANTVWDSNGTLTVTITETAAGIRASMPHGIMVRRMRRLARRALMYPELTRSSRVLDEDTHEGHSRVRFLISRNAL